MLESLGQYYITAAIVLPFITGPLFLLLHKRGVTHLGWISSFISAISLTLIIATRYTLPIDEAYLFEYPWIPSLGINFSFIVDGLSLFFGILVTGMGVLVNLYADAYMSRDEKGLGRFYCCLTSFMGAMIGAVFSDNLLLLYLFWELTGLFSYMLIGYYRYEAICTNNARLALLTTFLTGLFLFLGILFIGILDKTFLWSEIIALGINYTSYPFWSYLITLFFLIAIFGKSVQLPFHFWLPRAMVAPTPVSAFLHAATMVKLGIFLTARFYPLFSGLEIWLPLVAVVCFGTMLFGAVLSLFCNDLKELLAYATISQLGFFLGFYGMGGEAGVRYDFIHIFNHALYKGSLFMLVGIIHLSTGIRDIRYLGGLWNKLPLVTLSFFLAAGSMAGIPGTTGFLSKELVLGDLFKRELTLGTIFLFFLLIATMIFKVAFSLRLFAHLFIRPKGARFTFSIKNFSRQKAEERREIDRKNSSSATKNETSSTLPYRPKKGKTPLDVKELEVTLPSFALQIPPFILSLLAFIFGIWPVGLEKITDNFFVSALHLQKNGNLKLLHGWEYETIVSILILISGTLLFFIAERSNLWWQKSDIPDWGALCEKSIHATISFSKTVTRLLHPLSRGGKIALLFALFVVAIFWPLSFKEEISSNLVIDNSRSALALLLLFSISTTMIFSSPMVKLLSLSVTGFFLTLYFVYFLAPDLALTQILVEVISLLILITVFSLAGKKRDDSFAKAYQIPMPLRCLLSTAVGFAAFWTTWYCHLKKVESPLPHFFEKNGLIEGKGSNLVNIILVDYRGIDTLGEVAVLLIAALAVWALIDLSGKRGSPLSIPTELLKPLVQFIFVLVNIFALYLLFRGHNEPGGGFIAGLATGSSLIILSMAYDSNAILSLPLFRAQKLGAIGLTVMFAVAISPLLIGKSLLTHHFFGLPTPLIFDIGVALVVVSVTVGIYVTLRTDSYLEVANVD